MVTWACPNCGHMNIGNTCSNCGGGPPDYGRHFRALNLNDGPVFNAPVQMNVEMSNEEVVDVLTRWIGEDEDETLQETIRNKPTSLDQLVNFFVKLIFWTAVVVFGIGIAAFAFIFFSGVFGVR